MGFKIPETLATFILKSLRKNSKCANVTGHHFASITIMLTKPEIFKHFSQLQGQIPWVGLGSFPTPVGRLRSFARRLDAEIWIKRDDLTCSHHGGNKVRKLEFLFGEALERGAKHIITSGMLGSPQISVVGYHAGRLGLRTHIGLLRQPLSHAVMGRLELARQLGVKIWPCHNRRHVQLVNTWQMHRLQRAYHIPPGCTSPLGVLGHVSSMLELKTQINDGELPLPDIIVVALGSGGTVAGLCLGAALAGLEQVKIIGVRVVDRPIGRTNIQQLIERTNTHLARMGVVSRGQASIQITSEQLGRGYAYPTLESNRASRMCAEDEGILLDQTYSSKAMAHLLRHAGSSERRQRYLFWQTYDGRDLPSTFNGSTRDFPRRIRSWIKGFNS